MRTHIFVILVVAFSFISPGRIEAKMKQALFAFTNECAVSVQIDILNSSGKTVNQWTVKPGHEVAVGEVCRVVIHVGKNSREYSLPEMLYVRPLPQTTNKAYGAMLGGKWRLSIKDSELLEIACVEGGAVQMMPDLTKPPLGFPLRPRKANETFEQYQATLAEQDKILLKNSARSPLSEGVNQ